MNTLTERRALVVGGSSGIGRAIADAWSNEGMLVHVMSRSKPEGDKNLSWLPVDLADLDSTILTLRQAVTEPLHAVCFAAVYYGAKRSVFGEDLLSEWHQQIAVNLDSLWLTLAITLPSLRLASPGLFLNVSSEVVYNAGPGRSGYAATKAAGSSLICSLSLEETNRDVSFVSVLPSGMVDTPGIRKRRPDGFDYSDYMKPSCFTSIAKELVSSRLSKSNESFVVERDGTWRPVSDGTPASQSASSSR